MKILITGAEVEKAGNAYVVIYQDRIVFRSELRDVCIMTALNKAALDQLSGQVSNNVLRFKAR